MVTRTRRSYVVESIIAGVDYGVTFTLVSDIAMTTTSPERSGAATGPFETSFELG